jgi:hypothetical protein
VLRLPGWIAGWREGKREKSKSNTRPVGCEKERNSVEVEE